MTALWKTGMQNRKVSPVSCSRKNSRTNSLGMVVLFLLMGLALMDGFAFNLSCAEDLQGWDGYSINASAGYHFADIKGNRTKVGEYEKLDSGMEETFFLQGSNRRDYFGLQGKVLDEDDQLYHLELDAQRILQTETVYNRYIHYQDHESLTNQDYSTDFDPRATNALVVEDIKSDNTIRIPFLPNVTLNADFRQLGRRGHQQSTTVNHCTRCHLTSKSKRINQTIDYLELGAKTVIRGVSLNYSHREKDFHESGKAPVAYYDSQVSGSPVSGFQRYGSSPDSKTSLNRFRASSPLPLWSSLSFDYQTGETRNQDTHYKRDFRSTAVRFSTASLKYLTLNFNYHDVDVDNDVPGALEKDVTRRTVSFRTRPWKKNVLKGSYRWENIDRRNATPRSTFRKTFLLSLLSRPHRNLDFSIRYTDEQTNDPFANEEWGLFQSAQTSLPTRSDTVRVSFNWSPRGDCSFSSTVLYQKDHSSRYATDEDQLEMIYSIWYALREDLIITGYYSMVDSEIDTLTAYKTYHGWWRSDFLHAPGTPYDARTNCFNLMLNYRPRRNIALSTNLTYVTSNADFDADLYGVNVGDFSRLSIDRLETTIGLDYFCSSRLSFSARYNYRDYNDRENNDLDGEVNYLSIGLNYTF